MGHYQTAQICLNGHQITGNFHGNPEFRQDFCDQCGDKTITACPHCEKAIRGYYEPGSSGGVIFVAVPRFDTPSFCYGCGTAFPWTQRKIEAAQELADEIDELSPEEKEKLKDSIPDLTRDTTKTELASVRFKKLIAKAAPAMGSAIKDIVVSIATDAAKKSIGL